MIAADGTFFPYNAIDKIAEAFVPIDLDGDLIVVKRPLRESDPVQTIGVFASAWMPEENSYEMRGGLGGASEPTLSRYMISIQIYVKDMDAERGAAVHATLAKIVRSMLYRDTALHVALRALTANVAGSTESTRRFGVSAQRYLSNELSGSWLYLSIVDFWLETETS